MALPSMSKGLCPPHKELLILLHKGLAGLLVCFLLLSLPLGSEGQADRDVYLRNMTIFQTHEWFGAPRVYFRCSDNATKVFLPDVTTPGLQYTFSDYESWQPLTTLPSLKCKRCGFYEADTIKNDDVFGEWELCPLDFSADGLLNKSVTGEFDASFYCKDCAAPPGQNTTAAGAQTNGPGMGLPPSPAPSQAPTNVSSQTSSSEQDGKPASLQKGQNGLGAGLIVLIVVLSLMGAVGAGVGLVYLQKFLRRKRMSDHARAFDLLFDSGDELEEEMEKGRL